MSHESKLDSNAYRGGVQWQLRLQPDPRDERCEPIVRWISERLLARLRHLALAYELPLLCRLPPDGSAGYPVMQLAELQDELAFLSS